MTSPRPPFFQPLLARDRDEDHRAATPLELFFDLVVVIAIAAAAHGLAHEIATGRLGFGLIHFLMAFFAVWWPWNMFTWFASSFDNDDASYRLNVMVMMIALMAIAASIPSIFAGASPVFGFVGYVILRLASAVLWLRVGGGNPHLKQTAKRYGWGQIAMQGIWAVGIFGVNPSGIVFPIYFALAALLELLIPWYAERASKTPWHREHIVERFGLLNIIVLGEVLVGATHALEVAVTDHFSWALVGVGVCGMVMAFTMWWLYFSISEHLEDIEIKRTFVWGYGHFVVFAAGSAVGAGLLLLVDVIAAAGHGAVELSQLAASQVSSIEVAAGEAGHGATAVGLETAGFAIAIPLAFYVFGLWFVRDRYQLKSSQNVVMLFFAVLIALSGFLPYPPVPALVFLLICLGVRLAQQSVSMKA
ncbi:MAG: low temperature requirement protein A [Cyanobacteria bacterium P01_D01_bin.105]